MSSRFELASCLIVAAIALRSAYLWFVWAVPTLPMQWGLNGQPTWYAPRAVALGFVPALAVFVMVAVSFGTKANGAQQQALFVAILFLLMHLVSGLAVRLKNVARMVIRSVGGKFLDYIRLRCFNGKSFCFFFQKEALTFTSL